LGEAQNEKVDCRGFFPEQVSTLHYSEVLSWSFGVKKPTKKPGYLEILKKAPTIDFFVATISETRRSPYVRLRLRKDWRQRPAAV